MTDYRKLYDLEGYLFGEVSEKFAKTGSISAFDFFSIAVKNAVPFRYSLRDKDRYLWGKSYAEQLERDIQRGFK